MTLVSMHVAASLVAASAAGAAAWFLEFLSFDILACSTIAGLMTAIAIEDLRRLQVEDVLIALTALAGIAWQASDALSMGASLASKAPELGIQVAICGGAFLAVREGYYRLKGVDGLGLGDVKLAFAAGTWLGWDLFATATLLASASALAIVLATIVRHGTWAPDRRIPLAASLAPAIWVVWFAQMI